MGTISRRRFVRFLGVGVAGAVVARRGLSAGRGADAGKRARPNFIFFLSDDHGWADAGCYGNKVIRTPNLDALAKQGMRFTHAFAASPTCSPSRSATYTSLGPHRNGAHPNHSGIRGRIKTLPVYMKGLGYRVVLAGKTHVKPRGSFPFEYRNVTANPKAKGLERFLSPRKVAGLVGELGGPPAKPFCLIVATHRPHVTWAENRQYDPAKMPLPPYLADTPETRRAMTRYYTDVTLMDACLGACLSAVRKHGLADNTLLLYSSDQGAQWPFAKWNLYDAGIRVPLLARWPGRVEPAGVSDAMVSLIDVMPTLIEAAGGKPPAGIDGRSFLDVLLGKKKTHRDAVFAAHTGDGKMNRFPCRSVRTRTHKYILNLKPENLHTSHITNGVARDGRDYWDTWVKKARTDPATAALVRRFQHRPAEELYDLTTDPFEQNNIAAEATSTELLASLRERLRQWRRQQGETVG